MSHSTSKFRSTPTFTFKTRNSTITSSNLPQNIPSPDHYQINQHDISMNLKKGVKFPLQKKGLTLNISRDCPGPGTYESNLSINLGSFNKIEVLKKGEKRFRQVNETTPSPNSYQIIKYSRKSLPSFSIGKMDRSSHKIDGKLEGPAPNNYNPSFKTQEQSIFRSIGNSKRIININNVKIPGPGAYQLQKQFISISFNQKKSLLAKAQRFHSSKSVQQIPGPAAYQQKSLFIQNQVKKRGFTLRNRSQPRLLSTPGPGSYNNDSQRFKFKSGSGILLPRSQRKFFNSQTRRSSLIPGPGEHQLSTDQFSKMKSFSVSKSKFPKTALPHFVQSKEKQINFINPEKLDVCKSSVPKYTVGHSKRRETFEQQLKKRTPDKFYDYNLKVVSKSEIVYKLAQSQRMKKGVNSNLGPGAYNVQSNFLPDKKMKFSKQKRRTFLDDVIRTKQKTFKQETYQSRQQFPNPPKYMNVYKKLQINESKIKNH